MTKSRSHASLSAKKDRAIELLRRQDAASWRQALEGLDGHLDDDIAAEMLRLLQHGKSLELRLFLLEQIALELDSGLYGAHALASPRSPVPAIFSAAACAALQGYLEETFFAVREDARLRRKALEVAVLLPQPWQEDAIRECWTRPEPEWQASALLCMGHFLLADFSEEIEMALASPHEDLRAQAILAADCRDLTELGPAILAIAADVDSELEVRLCAIEALPNLRPEGAQDLLERLCHEGEPLCHFAVDALFSLEQNRLAEAKLEAEGEEILRQLQPRDFYGAPRQSPQNLRT